MKRIVWMVLLALVLAAGCEGSAQADPVRPVSDVFSFGPLERGRHAESMNGIQPTTYTGAFYARTGQRGEAFRLCVIHRESKGHYWSVNSGGYMGAYQFSKRFTRGLPYMVVRALMADGLPRAWAKRLRARLAGIPIERWSRRMQDIAFFAVLNHDGPFSGWRHWSLKGSKCNAMLGY